MNISRVREVLDAELIAGIWDESYSISGIQYDSRNVASGDVFFCIKGEQVDGHDYAQCATESGATVLVVERFIPDVDPLVIQLRVADTRSALARLSAEYWGHPSRKLKVFGVTGTNGKTTTTYLIDAIARGVGETTGIVGTVSTIVGTEVLGSERTTPESRDLQELLYRMAERGISTVSIEVSSHSLELARVMGVEFEAVAFTNLTQDHLDYHGSMDEYYLAKRRLFTDYTAKARVIDIDTDTGKRLAQDVGSLHAVTTVGRNQDAQIRVLEEKLEPDNSTLRVHTPDGDMSIELPLAGHYNVSNALVAIGCAWASGWSLDRIAQGLANANQVPGRMQHVSSGQPFGVVVDYAHTPDALDNVIGALRRVTKGRLITVFGCGGDRDPAKRPLMGQAAAAGSDYVIVTSDNPRTESPHAILEQVTCGVADALTPYEVIESRSLAIKRAIDLAHQDDCVLIAGKGHETYQDIAGVKHHFDDREQALLALADRGWMGDK